MLALMAIRDWPTDERPREKLLDKGAAAVSDAEILANLLRTGTPGRSARAPGPRRFHDARRDRARRCERETVHRFDFRPGRGDWRRAQARRRQDPAQNRAARHPGGGMYPADFARA